MQRVAGVVGERVVRHGDHHHVRHHREEVVDRGARAPAEPSRESVRRPWIHVEAADERVVAEGVRTLRPDRAAPDEAHAERRSLARSLGHVYSTP